MSCECVFAQRRVGNRFGKSEEATLSAVDGGKDSEPVTAGSRREEAGRVAACPRRPAEKQDWGFAAHSRTRQARMVVIRTVGPGAKE